ncbi:arginase family protein, partial [Leucobacter sp. M11]|uniref:arginase family protein n=1 Tax=Leucobacter sp. M11 TaxID=2993565 RepID=UPI002D80B523
MPENAVRFFLVPEWQGSPSSRAMRLIDGAEALREDLPPSATVQVPVPMEAGDSLGTPVQRLGSVLRVRDALTTALRGSDGPAIIVGGDCAADLAGLAHAAERHGPEQLAVLWLDAHPDFQHPATSPSGSASGMVLRAAIGDGEPEMIPAHTIDPARVVLAGTREADAEELVELANAGIEPLSPQATPAQIRDALLATGATRLYVHVDLDVLDPAEFGAVHAPVPFGLSLAQLLDTIRAAVAALPLAGAAICE